MSAGDSPRPTPARGGLDAHGTKPLPSDWTLGPTPTESMPIPVCLDNVNPGAGYTLLGRVGLGVFGEVFEAEAPGGVRVAIKRLFWPPDHPASLSEAKSLEATKRLSHPFLLKTHAYFVFADRLHIVMELAGGSLADRIEFHRASGRDGVPPEELIPIFEQAAQALEYLHREDVSHRDIKPQNLLLLHGYAKVADFGLARSLSHSLTALPGQVGTPMYMAPEVWDQKVGQHASDQYSLAAAYVVARLGRPPYRETLSILELADAHKYAAPDLGWLPPAEQRVVLRGLAKDPADRYPSCVGFAEDLRRVVLDRPRPAEPDAEEPAADPRPAGPREVAGEDQADAQTHHNQGYARYLLGDVAGAVAAYRQAIRIDPAYARAFSNLGNALKALGDVAGAVAAYRQAIRLDPKYAKTHNNLGVVLEAVGDADGAVAAYREAARLNPTDSLFRNNLGNALKAAGDATGAMAAHREAVRLAPADALYHNDLGVALETLGDATGAVAAYREAIRLDPKDALYHSNLGNALRAVGDADGAVVAYRQAIRLDPKDAKGHNNLGHALFANGDIDGAITAYREAIRLNPAYAKAHNNLGIALDTAGDADGAIAAYREAIRFSPAYAKAHNNLGHALYSKGDLNGAVAAYREALRLEPDNPRRKKALDRVLKLKS